MGADESLPFLDAYVAAAVARGCPRYAPPEDMELQDDYNCACVAGCFVFFGGGNRWCVANRLMMVVVVDGGLTDTIASLFPTS